MSFFDKLSATQEQNHSCLYISLDPDPELLGTTNLEEIWNWLKFVIKETSNLICAYKPTLDFYQALGAPGLELLQQTLRIIPPNIPIILDAKHSDLNTSTVFAKMVFEDWNVDACTLLPFGGHDHVAPFLVYPGKAVFVLCHTGNPAGAVLQDHPVAEFPLYLQLVQESQNWGTTEQLGLELGAVQPEILAKVRQAAPERVLLVLGDCTNAENLAKMLFVGLDEHDDGLLLPVPPDYLIESQPAKPIEALRDAINQERHQIYQGNPTCNLWVADVCFLQPEPHRDLILQLFDIGCLTFGDHVQASGATFPYYIDLRKIISQPQVFHQVVNAYADILQGLEFDRIAGIPYGSLPTATGLAMRLERPMIFPRKEVKAYGAKRLIEGHYEPEERVVVVDDILISGKSAIEGAKKLQSVGLEIEDIVVLIDHERGVKERLQQEGYRGHSVLTLTEIAQVLRDAARINEEQFQLLMSSH